MRGFEERQGTGPWGPMQTILIVIRVIDIDEVLVWGEGDEDNKSLTAGNS